MLPTNYASEGTSGHQRDVREQTRTYLGVQKYIFISLCLVYMSALISFMLCL